jgi:EmrB/QacA subfamily drug resistance transporter
MYVTRTPTPGPGHPPAGVGTVVATLSLATLAFSIGQTAVVPALPELAHALHTTSNDVTWTLTGYLICGAVFMPLLGRLGDTLGQRRVLVVALCVYAVGGVVSAVGGTIGAVIVGRMLQGVGGGVLPLCFSIIRHEVTASRRPLALGLISSIGGVGSAVGLAVGGLMIDHLSFRWIFWSGTLLAAIAAVAAHVFLEETNQDRQSGGIDVRGGVVLAVGISTVMFGLSRASSWGWGNGRTLGLVALGLLVLLIFVNVEARTERPLVDVGLLGTRQILTTNVATMFVGFGVFVSFVLVPQLAETPSSSGYGFGAGATRAGLLLVPGCIAMMIFGPLCAPLSRRIGMRGTLALGAVIGALGLVGLALAHGSELSIAAVTVVTLSGLGLALAAVPSLIVEAVPPQKAGESTGVNTLSRYVGSSVGAQTAAAMLAATVTASRSFPTEAAYEQAFVVSAGVIAGVCVMAALIPRRPLVVELPAEQELAAASPVGTMGWIEDDVS